MSGFFNFSQKNYTCRKTKGRKGLYAFQLEGPIASFCF